MKKLTDPERVRRAIAERDSEELLWALEYARGRARSAPSDEVRRYWDQIVERIETASAR